MDPPQLPVYILILGQEFPSAYSSRQSGSWLEREAMTQLNKLNVESAMRDVFMHVYVVYI